MPAVATQRLSAHRGQGESPALGQESSPPIWQPHAHPRLPRQGLDAQLWGGQGLGYSASCPGL